MTDNNFKYPLSFFYAILPQKVRLISRTVGYDTSGNRPAQNTSYFAVKVENRNDR